MSTEDDDGMLLNFSTEEVTGKKAKINAKVSGGRWKDRRRAQLVSQQRGRTSTTKKSNISEANSSELVLPRVNSESGHVQKRQRPLDSKTGPPTKQMKEKNGEFGGKNNSYVSSLFTSNPDIQHKEREDVKELEPSNAPLADSTTFSGLGLELTLSTHLTDHLRFAKPTKIQRSVIPRLLQREKDLFVQAQTGSGKTLSFVLPIFQKLMGIRDLNRESGLFAVILVPTRELAQQIYSVLETLTRCCHRIVPGIVIGGEKKKSEKARLRKGVNILVATPGRFVDHIDNTETLDLSQVRYLVMDEGDRLMDLGFEETISKILSQLESRQSFHPATGLPVRRVNVLCSATMKNDVKKLGEISLKDAELVSIDNQDNVVEFDELAAPDQLTQQVVVVPPKLRLVSLNALLSKITSSEQQTRTMVFFSCSDSVNFHFKAFSKDGYTPLLDKLTGEYKNVSHDESTTISTSPLLKDAVIFKLHGSLTQQIRTSTLQQFVLGKQQHTVMFCTDVASRGLDLPHISNIIEYDPAFSVDDHLHRVGRTARAGLRGVSTLFLLPGPEENYIDYIAHLHPSGLETLKFETVLKEGFVNEEKKDNWDYDATTWHLNVERWLLEDSHALDLAKQLFVSHIRAYATHLSAEREIFNVKLLHLGHLAKSFGLRETPKNLGRQQMGAGGSTKRKKEDPKNKLFRMARLAAKSSSSEFNFL